MKLEVKQLSSGYWHIRGEGPCNFAQVAAWPCGADVLEASFFPEAGQEFRREVRWLLERLTEAEECVVNP